MPDGGRFAHLRLPRTFQVPTAREAGGRGRNWITKRFEAPANRPNHAANLRSSLSTLKSRYETTVAQRQSETLPELPAAIPLFLKLDPEAYEPDSLSAFGIEVLLEEEGGVVIGASADTSFGDFEEKINKYLDPAAERNLSPAKIWGIQGGTAWRVKKLLSPRLQEIWPLLVADQLYIVDATVVVKGLTAVPPLPRREDFDSNEKFERAEKRFIVVYSEWDALMLQRQDDFQAFIQKLGGEVISSFYNDAPETGAHVDSFGCRIRVNGAGLKDLLENYPFLAALDDPDEMEAVQEGVSQEATAEPFNLEPPDSDAPKICVIDSGIQENHRYLDAAIQTNASRCFIPSVTLTADEAPSGGHGTRVAGIILYPRTIPTSGSHKARVWIQNARVLDSDNKLPISLYPPALIRQVVEHYAKKFGTRLYNHSISAAFPHRTGRMSAWAAAIDHLCYENDILFITAAGNIDRVDTRPTRTSVRDLASSLRHPDYLLESTCRVANPAQSLQALTVGSIALSDFDDGTWKSIAALNTPSAFSRTGFGLWGTIKPEVVEYGGDYVRDNSAPMLLTIRQETSPEMIRSTLQGGPAFARDNAGTSFAAPMVAHIAAEIGRLFPQQPALLYRGLIVQSARWPAWTENRPTADVLRLIGYGIPDLNRATQNTEFRATVITQEVQRIRAGNMDLYEIPIPENLRRQGENHRIRIEVTLSYKARPHRLRRTTRRYLSTWLDWTVNSTDETTEMFVDRVKKRHDQSDPYEWTISKLRDRGAQGVRLHDNTVQKDWTVVDSFRLPEVFCIAIVAHEVTTKKDAEEAAEYSLAVTFESEGATIPVYNQIRAAVETHITGLEARAEAEVVIQVATQPET